MRKRSIPALIVALIIFTSPLKAGETKSGNTPGTEEDFKFTTVIDLKTTPVRTSQQQPHAGAFHNLFQLNPNCFAWAKVNMTFRKCSL